jgi:hypothetical protein
MSFPETQVAASLFTEEYLALVVISSALSVVCSQNCGFKEEETVVYKFKIRFRVRSTG